MSQHLYPLETSDGFGRVAFVVCGKSLGASKSRLSVDTMRPKSKGLVSRCSYNNSRGDEACCPGATHEGAFFFSLSYMIVGKVKG